MVKSTFEKPTIAICGLLLCLAARGNSQVIYDNGPPNQVDGNEMTEWIQANSFTLTGTETITGVNFWDFEANGAYQGSVTYDFYADNSGSPGTSLDLGSALLTQTATGNTVQGGTEFADTFSVPSIVLGPGTYWLGLHNGPLSTQARDDMYWERTNPTANNNPGDELIAPFTGSFISNGNAHAFQILGSQQPGGVPEPGSTAMLFGASIPLAGLLIRRRRRR